MKVLMLGWEFPPFIAGGLGTACYGLTRAMNALGVDILFVLPRPVVAHAPTPTLPPASTNGHAPHAAHDSRPDTTVSNDPPITMVGAHYTFPHAQQSGTPTVSPPIPESATTRMTFLDYNVNEFQHVTFRTIDALLSPYLTPEQYRQQIILRERRLAHFDPAADAPSPGSPTITPPPVPVAPAAQAHGPLVKSISLAPQPAPRAATHKTSNTPLPAPPPPPNMPELPSSMLIPPANNYAMDLMTETARYASLVAGIAHDETFDVIHAHDWMTFRAGIAAQAASGMPLIVHVHSTEFDRNPQHPNQEIIDIETDGMEAADLVIAVSHMTRRLLITRYNIPEDKIEVVHNAIDGDLLPAGVPQPAFPVRKDEKIVLFLGRITAQKGPEYFLAAARKVLDVYEPVKFIMAGAGDLMKPTIELAAAMGIGHKVLFTGFLNARDVEKIYQMADLYVMPSISEPFGIAPLEALSHNIPVIVSKQCGVAEVLKHALKVDFWDIDALADRILAVLRHAPLVHTLRQHAREEVRKMSWVDSARRVLTLYKQFEQVEV